MFYNFLILALVALALLLFCIILYYKYYAFTYWKKRGVPDLPTTIPFGNTLNLYTGKCNFGELFANWYLELQKNGHKHGGCYFFGKPVYIPVDAEIIKSILISDFAYFPNHGMYIDHSKNSSDPLSMHIFNMEGYKWKNLRTKLPQMFTTLKMKSNVKIMEEISKELVSVLDNYEHNKESVDIKNVLHSYTLDIVSQSILGIKPDVLQGKNKDLKRLSKVFFDNQWSILKNTLVLLIPRYILKFFNFQLFTKETVNYFMKLFGNIKEQRFDEKFKRNDLTDTLFRLGIKEDEILKTDFTGKKPMEPLNFEEIAAQLYVFFEAGHETSSSTQSFVLYELAINQHCQDKLRKEIRDVLQNYNGNICYESVSEMKYLEMVIDETLRLYPIFPILPRVCVNDYKVPGTNLTLEKNTMVMVTNLGVQKNPEYWPNPEKFDPERFTTENKGTRPYAAYLPFGEGPRICIGKRFGIWQTKMGIASIINNFKIKLSKRTAYPRKFAHPGLILNLEGNVWLDLEKIN